MKPKPARKIDYPLFIDMDLNHVPFSERQKMYEHFKTLAPYYGGIDPRGRVWLRFPDPHTRATTRQMLLMVLTRKMGYLCQDEFESIDQFKKLQNQ